MNTIELAQPAQQEPVAWVWNPAKEAWEQVRAFGHWQQGAIYAFGPIPPVQPAQQEPVACFIGTKGSAFDLPSTKRAYTYAEQPSNLPAYKLGKVVVSLNNKSFGDCLDAGLLLLKELQAEGFGVFDLGAEYAAPQPAQQEPAITFEEWYADAHWGNEDFKQGCHRAWNAAKAQPAQQERTFTKYEVDNADDWSEWVDPKQDSYLMACCDCDLVHELQFRVAKYADDTTEYFDVIEDKNLHAQFRAKRRDDVKPAQQERAAYSDIVSDGGMDPRDRKPA